MPTSPYKSRDPVKARADSKRYYWRHPEKCRERAAAYDRANPEIARARNQRWRSKLLDETYAAYGNACACCGETERAFLTIDHVNGDGAEHRRRLDGQRQGNPTRLLIAARREGFPPYLQILCWNCNCSKGLRGGCPHERFKVWALTA